MRISIVTNEPYHDNSEIVSVQISFDDAVAVAIMLAEKEPDKELDDAWNVAEWDVSKDVAIRSAFVMRRPLQNPWLNHFEHVSSVAAGVVIKRVSQE